MTSLLAAVALVGAAVATAQESGGAGGYCDPANALYDPPDVPAAGAEPLPLPKGFSRREVEIDGVRTVVIEGGPRRSRRALVFVHGSPGSGQDWLGIMKAAARHTRVVAYDVPGFGHASKPWDRDYTLANGIAFFEQLLKRLKIRRATTLGHDVGASTAIEWAVRHPRRTDGVVIISGGIAPGYDWHTFAKVWRTEGAGEAFMLQLRRDSWHWGLQRGQQKPLPREFIDRLYDDYNRETRCAVLDLYRRVDEPGETGTRQAAAIRRHNLPALVIWGRHDPYISVDFAEKQRLGFPKARIHVFEDAAHWPFVDEPERAARLVARFARSAGRRR